MAFPSNPSIPQARPPILLHDELGSTRLLTDPTGAVTGTYSYDAYGNATSHTGTATTPLQWAGQYHDPATGFYYLRARCYDPSTGQFLTVDPLVSLTQAPFSYSSDDPINNSDPDGLITCSSWIPGCGVVTDVQNAISGATTGAAHAIGSELAPSGTPAYVGICVSGGFIVGGQFCVDYTKYGKIYLSLGGGLSTPGVTVSGFVAYIHGAANPAPCQINNYLHAWTLQGSAAAGPYASGVWGNEGQTGNSDYGDEFGLGWLPGASLIQSFGFGLPFNLPGF